MLSAHRTVVLCSDLAGGDGVAVGDVGARVKGVPDGEVDAAIWSLGRRPRVSRVVALALRDLGQDVRALHESTA